jgi:hypothetical protein
LSRTYQLVAHDLTQLNKSALGSRASHYLPILSISQPSIACIKFQHVHDASSLKVPLSLGSGYPPLRREQSLRSQSPAIHPPSPRTVDRAPDPNRQQPAGLVCWPSARCELDHSAARGSVWAWSRIRGDELGRSTQRTLLCSRCVPRCTLCVTSSRS